MKPCKWRNWSTVPSMAKCRKPPLYSIKLMLGIACIHANLWLLLKFAYPVKMHGTVYFIITSSRGVVV